MTKVEIKLKGQPSIYCTQYSSVHGVMETDGTSLAGSKRQTRLAISYSPLYRAKMASSAGMSSMDSLINLPQAKTVKEAKQVRNFELCL